MASKIIILSLVAAVAMTASTEEPIAIVRQSQDSSLDGSFHSHFETANGITIDEEGILKNPGTKEEAEEVHGSAAWTAPDGTEIKLDWLANENGANLAGSHLPTPPPIPDAIQRSLDWIEAHPQLDSKEDKH